MDATVVHMIPETSPHPLEDRLRPLGDQPLPEPQGLRSGARRAGGPRRGDLKRVEFLHDAHGNPVVPPFPVLEVERPEPPRDTPRGPWRTLWPWYVAAVLAPLLVLLGALALPVIDPVRGTVLVGGWIVLGAVTRWFEKRRRRHRT